MPEHAELEPELFEIETEELITRSQLTAVTRITPAFVSLNLITPAFSTCIITYSHQSSCGLHVLITECSELNKKWG
jgi:hypothetical protein